MAKLASELEEGFRKAPFLLISLRKDWLLEGKTIRGMHSGRSVSSRERMVKKYSNQIAVWFLKKQGRHQTPFSEVAALMPNTLK